MFKFITKCTVVAVCVFTLTPVVAFANTDQLRLELLQQLVALLELKLEQLQALQLNASGSIEGQDHEGDIIGAYRVTSTNLTRIDGRGSSDDKEYWDMFVRIASEDFINDYLGEFLVYENDDDILAYVESIGDNSNQTWRLAINAETSDPEDDEIFKTLIHEYTHILTLNPEQVDASESFEECETIYVAEGCPNSDAYYELFVRKYWTPDDFETSYEAEEEEDPTDFMLDYFEDREDEFVSEYAMTNPFEDMAESFTEYVLADSFKNNTRADEKISFFNLYPELREIRTRIRAEFEL